MEELSHIGPEKCVIPNNHVKYKWKYISHRKKNKLLSRNKYHFCAPRKFSNFSSYNCIPEHMYIIMWHGERYLIKIDQLELKIYTIIICVDGLKLKVNDFFIIMNPSPVKKSHDFANHRTISLVQIKWT